MTTKATPLPSVQALRAVAALLVLVGHALHETDFIAERTGQAALNLAWMDWGFGVDIFFVISGFIMLYTSGDRFEAPRAPREFLVRRIQRVVPLYWFMTTAFILGSLVAPRLLNVPIEGWQSILESYFFIPGLRANGETRPIFALGWTLNYEMFFYLCFACCLIFPIRRGLLLLVTFFLCLVAAGALVKMSATALAFWADSIILEFLFGVAIAWSMRAGMRLSRPASIILLALGAVLAVCGGPLFGVDQTMPRCIGAGIPAAMIVFAAACGPQLRAGWLTGLMVLLGNASYSLYLSHPFVVRPLRSVWMALPTQACPMWLYIALCFVAASVAAVLIYRLIERPLTEGAVRLGGAARMLREQGA